MIVVTCYARSIRETSSKKVGTEYIILCHTTWLYICVISFENNRIRVANNVTNNIVNVMHYFETVMSDIIH